MTTTVWTANFTVSVDRADHLVIEQITETGTPVRTIDYGITGGPAVVLAWLDLDDAVRGDMAPAIDAYLTAEFSR